MLLLKVKERWRHAEQRMETARAHRDCCQMAFMVGLWSSRAQQYGEEKKPYRIHTALSSPGISKGLEQSCEHSPMVNPQPRSRVCSRTLCTPLTMLWHNGCISPTLARLETLEINDQKKESIWEIKALC